ncbi:MAG: AAA family ATPase [Sulfuricurvum sp.]
MSEEIIETQKRSYNLKNLFLDPNNYRFVDNENYRKINEKDLLDLNIQKRTRSFIEGNKRENIRDLIASFKANGFLDVDVIQVRNLGNNQYLVLEGNRRVTALKALQEDYEKGLDIGNLNPAIFKSVPFEIHSNEENKKHLIIMGLKHISGNKKWSALNQSKLIYDYLIEFWRTDLYYQKEEELCDSLGVSKQKIRTSQRAYFLILEYLKSDFGDQFTSDSYSIFVEIIKRPTIKDWLEWNDYNYEAANKINQDRLFSWISKVEDVDNDSLLDEEKEEEKDYKELEPIISKSIEIRDLSIFINNELAINEMEKYRSVSRGLLASGEIDKQNYEKTLIELGKSLQNLRVYKDMLSSEDIDEIENLKNTFINILPKKSSLNIIQGNISICFEHGKNSHFSSISIEQYRVLNKFKIENLNRINIFAGFNNTGKTSLLEAIYLLTKQNDIASFLELIRLKNKMDKLSPIWLNKIFTKDINISARYNSTNVSVDLSKFEAKDIDKKDDYITSYKLQSKIEQDELNNIIHTFAYQGLKRENEQVRNLCNAILKSPYFYNLEEVLKTHDKSVRIKDDGGKTAIELIVDFLKNIDKDIKYIELTSVDENIKRFIVDYENSLENLDITNYGEGLQRIFEIALAFAYCKNGVICIDEFETAVHYSLLVGFTELIQELAVKFSVQVFLTTHSKESIRAFIENNYKNEDISFYTLVRNKENRIQTIYYDSSELQNSIEQDLELRGW